MRPLRWLVAGVVFGLNLTAIAAPTGSIIVSHYETLQRFNMQSANSAVSPELQGTGPVTLSFDALGRTFDFQLEPNNGFLSAVSREALPDGIGIYRGQLVGNTNSWARIVVFDGVPRGLFSDGTTMYAIEAPGDSVVDTATPIIYRLADIFIEPGSMTCGTQSLSGNGALMYSRLVSELSTAMAQGPGAFSEISIGAVGDFEFTSAQGSDALAAAAITTRMNTVDGIYSQEIGVQINIPLIETFSDAADPFTNETDPAMLLNEVRMYRQGSSAQNSQGLTHLWTGRDLGGTTVGIAFENVLCVMDAGAGLSEGSSNASFDSLVAAHEIGHNFGAPHDGVPGLCENALQDFIMAPTLNGSNQFSQCTIDIMQANADLASCVTALATVDMSVRLSGQPATVFLSNSPELTIDLSNNGGSDATNVSVDITLPANVTFVSATPSAGTCTNGAGTVSCALGGVPGQSSRTVMLITDATTVGTGTFGATVSADVDERATNNQASVQLTVDPAVDLVVNTPSSASVNLDQSTTANVVLENRSVMDATGVTLSISLNSGLQANTATWSIGTCTVTAQQVDCQTALFANQSSSTLDIGVTGLTAGNRTYTVTLASNEADANSADNSLNGRVRVNDPDDEGGGALGLPFLFLLGLTGLMTRRRNRLNA